MYDGISMRLRYTIDAPRPYRSTIPTLHRHSIVLLGGPFPANVLSFPLDPVPDRRARPIRGLRARPRSRSLYSLESGLIDQLAWMRLMKW